MRLKPLAGNLALTLFSLLLTLLLLELVLFRLVLPASDLPRVAWIDGVIRHTPGDTGVYRVRDEIAARFRINADGWNSGYALYPAERTPGTARIAIVGDSYVQALQVDHDASFAELLEKRLKRSGPPVEVFRFGIGGAPLSHYLHMLRNEVIDLHPDVVVLNVVHNDFTESFRFQPGVYTSAFLKLEVEDGRVVGEIPPAPWTPAWYEPLRRSATWRYLAVRRGFSFSLLRDLLLGAPPDPETHQANVDLRDLNAAPGAPDDGPPSLPPEVEATARYVLNRFRALADVHGFRPVVVMDGVRQLVEQRSPAALDYDRGALRLNRLVRRLCSLLEIPFLDLQPVFAGQYAVDGRPFGHEHDAHWNAHAHAVVAESLADLLRAPPPSPPAGD